jgi:hypothetical protein
LLRQKSQFISPAIENFAMKERERDTVPLDLRIKYMYVHSLEYVGMF